MNQRACLDTGSLQEQSDFREGVVCTDPTPKTSASDQLFLMSLNEKHMAFHLVHGYWKHGAIN
jgi:hypothetical protein